MKHFEDLWNEAEKLSSQLYGSDPTVSITRSIEKYLDVFLEESIDTEKAEAIGKVLFMISYLSQKHGINVYQALISSMEDAKINLYDPDNG